MDDPTYDHTQWGSPGELMADLLQNKKPTPFWIKFGRTLHRITPDTREQVARGILIAMEFKEEKL